MKTRISPKILVVGGGAIGGFYGGKLAQGGARVSVVCRSNFEIVKAAGFKVKSIWGNFEFFPDQVVQKVEDYNGAPDFILITVKALPKLKIPAMIQKVVKEKTSIVLFQNGIDIEYAYLRAFPKSEILSGLAFVCVSQFEPGHIDHQDFGRVCIGRYPEGNSGKSIELSKIFNANGVPCTVSDNIVTERWKKLLWNASFNPLSILGEGKNTQEIMQCPDAEKLILNIMQEVRSVAISSGHHIDQEEIKKHLSDTKVMKAYKTSMLLDYEAGKQLEIEAIVGNLIKIAEVKNISIPYSKAMYHLLKLITSSK